MLDVRGNLGAGLQLSTYDGEYLNAIIETPMGSHAKYAYDENSGLFKLKTVLPAGLVFPYNFGFLPATRGEDGDPLDILVLMDAVAYPGCLLPARLIGVLEGEQTEKVSPPQRNDRLISVGVSCPTHGELEALDQLPETLVAQIESFLVSYNKFRGKTWSPLGRHGPRRASRLIKAGMDQQQSSRRQS